MSEHDTRVQVERLDWPALLPWLHLFRSFRMAMHPAKLGLALLLVVLLYMGGMAMDVIWGTPVESGAFERYRVTGMDRGERMADLIRSETPNAEPVGIFRTFLDEQNLAFRRLVGSAVQLDFGVGEFLAGRGLDAGGVAGALGHMLVTVPRWLLNHHPAFLLIYGAWVFLVTGILGGAIARLAALHACRDLRPTPLSAMRFVGVRYPWFFLSPLIPLGLVALIGLGLMVVGLLFNLPGLDVVAALLYGLLLIGGLVAALLLIGLAAGVHLLLPALAVEGSDAFDAISRVYNYIFGRPWRYLFYTGVAIVYGAATYLLLALIVFITLWLTRAFAAQWVFGSVEDQVAMTRFEAMLGEPRIGRLLPPNESEAVGGTATFASIVLGGWVRLLVALLPAFAVSFYFCAHTWIYLLLRRAADGTEFDDLFLEARPEDVVPPEKLEPAEA